MHIYKTYEEKNIWSKKKINSNNWRVIMIHAPSARDADRQILIRNAFGSGELKTIKMIEKVVEMTHI